MTEARKFSYPHPENELLEDLERYRDYALALGATEAKIVGAQDMLFDPRVRLKCLYPKCHWYGTNAHCPPHVPEVEEMRRMVSPYRYGIFYCIRVPTEGFAGTIDGSQKPAEYAERQLANYKIASLVEARAFHEGYVLAVGFAGGPCKPIFCSDKDCSAIIQGQGCRAVLRARTSLEGAGIYALAMAAKAGWDVYPRGRNAESVTYHTALGMVLID